MVRTFAIACLPLALLLSSCASVTRVAPAQMPRPLDGPALTYAEPGELPYAIRSGSRVGAYGCATRYETYVPQDPKSDVMVMLGHGFMRDLRAMRGWAAHWASHGIEATVVSFCNSKLTAGNHDRNAADLVALARELHPGPVIYAGFSAGGLAAFLAAAADERAVAYLGLDAVDSGRLAGGASAGFRVPALFLMGESSSCNAKNNFLPAIPDRSDVTSIRVLNATHGHFENPYDPRVEALCGKVQPPEASEDILTTVRALATAWILDRAAGVQDAASVLAEARGAGGAWARRIEVLQGGAR
jgi:pimeloyl-ACP methyl ester carboxylesterase